MLDVAALQQFDFFTNFTLCAGAGGLGRSISNVVVLDHEGFLDDFTDFHEGDFVLTNLFYAKDDPALILSSFSKLMNIGVSAIAVKTIFYQELPKEVIALSDKRGIPVFIFHSIYIEDVILCITDYIRSSTDYSHYEKLIDQILHTAPETEAAAELIDGMDATQYAKLSCMYLSYRKNTDSISIQRYLNKLQLAKSNLPCHAFVHFRKYHKGILFFYFYAEQADVSTVKKNWQHLFFDLSISKSDFYVGISDLPLPLTKLETAIQRSLYAARAAAAHQGSGYYSTLSTWNIFLPISEHTYVREYLADLGSRLFEEENGNIRLFDTLRTYVKNDFSIDRTAQELFQHPNTIRYRIAKVKSLFHTSSDAQFQMLALLFVNTLP